MKERKFYLYKIINLINKKIYIGKTENIKKRWNSHKTAARRQNANDYTYFHRALNKHGFANFKIEIITGFLIEKEALLAEKEYIALYHSYNRKIGYNLTLGGDGISGYRHTAESKKLMSLRKRGLFEGKNNPFYGKTHSLKTKLQLSQIASERIGDSNHFKGKKHSEKSKEKMRLNFHRKEKALTTEEIILIKKRKFELKQTYKEIAQDYQLHWKTISNAVNKQKSYKD